MWEEEVSFYNWLLCWWKLNCESNEQAEIEKLQDKLDELRIVDLPAIKERSMWEDSTNLPIASSTWTDMHDLRELFATFEQGLNKIKSKVFQQFTKSCHVTIW